MTERLLRLLATLHARGWHAAVLAGLVMGPAVIAAGFLSDAGDGAGAPRATVGVTLRGSLDPARP